MLSKMLSETEQEALRLYCLLRDAGITCPIQIYMQNWAEYKNSVVLKIQATSQELASAVRVLLPCVPVWSKDYQEGLGWWENNGVSNGVEIRIYAMDDAPPTCRKVETQITEEIDVPIAFEKKTVTRTVTRYECGSREVAHG